MRSTEHGVGLFHFALGVGNFFRRAALVCLCLALYSLALRLCLASLLLGACLLLCCGFASTLLGAFLSLASFAQSAFVLGACSFCFGTLASQLLRTALLRSGGFGSLATCLLLGTLARLLHFYSDESVDLCIEGAGVLTLLRNHALYSLLLLLQRVDHSLLFALLAFERAMLLSALVEHHVFLSTHLLQLLMLFVHLQLLRLHHLALSLLPRRVFAHEAQTAVHLGEALRREDEHQAVLHGVLS